MQLSFIFLVVFSIVQYIFNKSYRGETEKGKICCKKYESYYKEITLQSTCILQEYEAKTLVLRNTIRKG